MDGRYQYYSLVLSQVAHMARDYLFLLGDESLWTSLSYLMIP